LGGIGTGVVGRGGIRRWCGEGGIVVAGFRGVERAVAARRARVVLAGGSAALGCHTVRIGVLVGVGPDGRVVLGVVRCREQGAAHLAETTRNPFGEFDE
jgi:hypothetical protein